MSPEPYYADELVTLHLGDCREITEWLSADVLVTDPPYGYSHASGWAGPFRDSVIAGDDSLAVRDAVMAAWGSKPALVFGNWKTPPVAGTHTVLIWDKGLAAGMGDLSVPWKPNHENVFVVGKGFTGSRDSSILTGNVVTWASKGRFHANMKPVGLMSKLITKTVGVIADPFAGAGSTLVAAKALGRRCIGVEVEERYCEVIARRLDQGVLDFGGVA